MSREVITEVVVRCDFDGSVGTENEPIVTRTFSWDGKDYEVDVCPVDDKEVTTMFEALVEKSRRPEVTRQRRSYARRAPYAGKLDEYKNPQTGRYDCPGKVEGGAKCVRDFPSANGLQIHHQKKHGSRL